MGSRQPGQGCARCQVVSSRARDGARLDVVVDVVYAQAGDGTHVAYRVLDADPSAEPARDIVMVPGGLFPLELFEEEPGFARLLDGLRALGRVITFDRRGIGQSDPIQDWERPVVDQWTDDLAAVVDASGADDIVLVTWDGFGVGSRYAAMHPERVSALVLYEPFVVADEDWESWSARRMQRGSANLRGEDDILTEVAPSRIADREFRDWFARAGRMGASPSTAPRIWESVMRAPPRNALLEQVVAPTLVLHRRDNLFATDNVLNEALRADPARRRSSSWKDATTSRSWATSTHSSQRSRRSSSANGGSRRRRGSSPRCCSPTSSAQPSERRHSVTRIGSPCSIATTRRCGRSSGAAVARSSRPPATACSRCSPRPGSACAPPPKSAATSEPLGSTCASVCTSATSTVAATTSRASR